MKKLITLTLLLLTSLCVMARRDPIIVHKGGTIGDRSGLPISFDMPAVFYEHDFKTQEIIIDGGGAVSYYDVEISSTSTGTIELMTSVSGTYDTFDISSLSSGSHVITITSSLGNVYEGTFTKY